MQDRKQIPAVEIKGCLDLLAIGKSDLYGILVTDPDQQRDQSSERQAFL